MAMLAQVRIRSRCWAAAGLALLTLLSPPVSAFNFPLQPEEIQEAYSLGRTTNHEELSDFLSQYEHDFKYPADNPVAYVTSVEFQTPYEQIVSKSASSAQYDKFRAAEDYQASEGVVFVRIIVALKTAYPGPPPAADSFQVTVSQEEPVEPVKTTTRVLCDPYSLSGWDTCSLYTREILLRFRHEQFGSGKATVKVLLPDEKSLETKFNLDKLK